MIKISDSCDSLVFDLDGTLWDPTDVCFSAWESVLRRVRPEMPVTRERLRGTFGLQHDAIAKVLFPDLPEAVRDQIITECFAEEIRAIRKFGGRLFPDVESVLQKLRSRFRLLIVSNCQAGYIEAFFHFHDLSACFDDFECSGNTGLPKKDNLRAIAQRQALKDPIYIGDTQGDYDAAKANGMVFGHAAYGFGKVTSADFSLGTFKDLEEIAGFV